MKHSEKADFFKKLNTVDSKEVIGKKLGVGPREAFNVKLSFASYCRGLKFLKMSQSGMSYADIARTEKLSDSTISKLIHRARMIKAAM